MDILRLNSTSPYTEYQYWEPTIITISYVCFHTCDDDADSSIETGIYSTSENTTTIGS